MSKQISMLSSQHTNVCCGGWCGLHAPRDSIRWIMEGYDEGISLCSDLVPIVVGYFGTHDSIMDRRCNLHDLQTALHGHNHATCYHVSLMTSLTRAMVQMRDCGCHKRNCSPQVHDSFV